MRGALRLAPILLALACAPALAQSWGAEDDAAAAQFDKYARRCQWAIDRKLWEDGHGFVRAMQSYLEQIEDRGNGDHAKAVALRKRLATLRAQVESHGQGASEGASLDVSSGAALSKALDGKAETLRLTGALELPKGRLEVARARLRLRGGFAPGFDARDVVGQPTVIGAGPRARPGGAAPMVRLRGARDLRIEGVVFDGRGLARYDSQGRRQHRRSARGALLRIEHAGTVLIRDCVFVNGPGVELVGTGDVTLENCVFLGCVGPALTLDGQATYRVLRCTFAATARPDKKTSAPAIRVAAVKELTMRSCVVSRADAALALADAAAAVTELDGNVLHGLTQGALLKGAGRAAQTVAAADLPDAGLRDTVGNRERDPGLALPKALLDAWSEAPASAPLADGAKAWSILPEEPEAGARNPEE